MADKPVRSRKFTPEQIDTALLTLAACAGNSVTACAALEERGIKLNPRTLRLWRERQYTDRYIKLANDHGREIEEVAVQGMRETVLLAAGVQQKAIRKTEEQLDQDKVREPSAIAKNMSIVMGVNTDKLLTLTGRPNAIHQTRSAEELYEAMLRLGQTVEGTAEEVKEPPPRLPETAQEGSEAA